MKEWTPDPSDKSVEVGDCEIGTPGKSNGNGWSADDMFKINTSKFDIKTSYDSTLTGYTVELNKRDLTEGQVTSSKCIFSN